MNAAPASLPQELGGLIDDVDTAVVRVDPNGMMLGGNPASRALFGLRALRGGALASHIAPASMTLLFGWLRELGRGTGRAGGEIEVRVAGGSTRWMRVTLTSHLVTGRPELLAAFTDVEDLVRTRERLRASQQRLRGLLEVLPDGVFVTDASGVVVYANASAGALLRAPESELTGADWRGLVCEDDHEVVGMLRCERQGRISDVGLYRQDGEGSVIVALSHHIVTFEDLEGELWIARDVTISRQVQAQLSQSDRLASVGVLAAGVAHEVNNPLAHASLSLERLQERLAGSDLADDVDEALAAVRRAADIVSELQGFARGDRAGRASAVAVRGELDTAVRMAQAKLATMLELQVAEDLGSVRVAPGRLSQVFLNVILNAVQSIESARPVAPRLQIHARTAGGVVEVEFVDNGGGVAPELLPRLKEPFFTTKAPGQGSGLGLYVCHEIITGLGGSLEVVNGAEGGAVAKVALPIEVSATPERAPSSQRVEELRLPTDARILVVDDEAGLLHALQAALCALGTVDTASSGQEAIARCRAHQYDAVLCDVVMPGGSGVEVLQWLRAHRPDRVPGFAFLTGGDIQPDAAAEVSSSRVLRKPVRRRELLQTCAELVERGRAPTRAQLA